MIPSEAIEAAKEAMREVTPPPGVSKADWLAEHGEFALIAGAIAAAAPHLSEPRQIRTMEELDALPDHSVILAPQGYSAQKTAGNWWVAGEYIAAIPALPAAVLHVGDSE